MTSYPKLYYLASPYTHEDPFIKEARFNIICNVAARLMRVYNFHLFVPIAMSHPIQLIGGCAGSWAYWEEYDKLILARCDELLVVTMDGWESSIGVIAEIAYAKQNNLPVRYVNPDTLSLTMDA